MLEKKVHFSNKSFFRFKCLLVAMILFVYLNRFLNWEFLYGPEGLVESIGFIQGLMKFNILETRSIIIHWLIYLISILSCIGIFCDKTFRLSIIWNFLMFTSMATKHSFSWLSEDGTYISVLPMLLLISTSKERITFHRFYILKFLFLTIYASGLFWKFFYDPYTYLSGEAAYFVQHERFFPRFPSIFLFQIYGGIISKIVTWGSLLSQFIYICCLVSSNRVLRKMGCYLIFGFHLGTFIVLEGTALFALSFIPFTYLVLKEYEYSD